MTKKEAIDQMREGVKITHKYFSPDEWMTIENGKIVLDDGVKCNLHQYWSDRQQEYWNDGYSFYVNPNNSSYLRPKTRGELLNALKQNIKCEIVATNEEFTSSCLDGWLKFKGHYKTYPSKNIGWVIYERMDICV